MPGGRDETQACGLDVGEVMANKNNDLMGGVAVLMLYVGGVCIASALGGWQAGLGVGAWFGLGGMALVAAEEGRR